jgi:hypothetical protein
VLPVDARAPDLRLLVPFARRIHPGKWLTSDPTVCDRLGVSLGRCGLWPFWTPLARKSISELGLDPYRSEKRGLPNRWLCRFLGHFYMQANGR